MTKRNARPAIRLRGVRQNNLKNFDLDLPIGKLCVFTGLSGSGKSSLAFDTLFAEGQRRYIETFSPYARQFFDRMDKPRVRRIDGIPPAIAIEQRNSVRTTRSTVGTMTEICDYMKLLWPHLAQLHCRGCSQPVRREPPQTIWETLSADDSIANREVLITFDVPLSEKLSLAESLGLIAKQGFQRLLIVGEVVRIEEFQVSSFKFQKVLTVVQDRVKIAAGQRARFIEACEQAYHFGHGRLTAQMWGDTPGGASAASRAARKFSAGFHCATCDLEYREPTPALFSFNHPVGACPACKGFGRIIRIDYDLAVPDRSKTLAEGVVKPWQSGMSAECQTDLMKFCRASDIRTDAPFERLSQRDQDLVINGDADYDPNDPERSWPRLWYGVKGYFRWLESKAYKMHVRVLLSRYRAYTTCSECRGKRLQPDALLYVLPMETRPVASGAASTNQRSGLSLADFYALPLDDSLALIDELSGVLGRRRHDPLALALNEVRARLRYLVEVGLGYLTLDRPTRTLSGGETERVNLTTCLGTRLVNTLFVLDEPSVGLHPRDTAQLVRILERLRDTGNTVVVVEHEASVIHAADDVVDLGPGQGERGGEIVFHGPVAELLCSEQSLTGQYLSGRKTIEAPSRRPVIHRDGHTLERVHTRRSAAWLRLANAARHNLKNLTVEIPLERFVCLTGVSGSGKTTLVREILLPALEAKLKAHGFDVTTPAGRRFDQETDSNDDAPESRGANRSVRLTGWESLTRVVLVDQSSLGKTPRSNPVVYVGAFDDIRDLFAQTEAARQRGLNSSAFSFNSAVGQCERCRGAGFEKIEMQFLSDVFIRCPECNGRRYRESILDVRLNGASATARGWSIADMLEATIDDALNFLARFAEVPAGRRALARLRLLQDVGLGYLRLGQPINTLSGGESQRLKLVSHLAEAIQNEKFKMKNSKEEQAEAASASADFQPTLFLFDEPTTGLHFDDVRVLLQVFQRLVDTGHSVLVIEHNLEVIKCADWVIDLGPEAGERGGEIVVAGTPEAVAACPASHTGQFLRAGLGPGDRRPRTRSEKRLLANSLNG